MRFTARGEVQKEQRCEEQMLTQVCCVVSNAYQCDLQRLDERDILACFSLLSYVLLIPVVCFFCRSVGTVGLVEAEPVIAINSCEPLHCGSFHGCVLGSLRPSTQALHQEAERRLI